MTLHDVLCETDLIKDNTEITLIKNGRQCRGRWCHDHIIDHYNDQVEMVAVHVTQNSAQIILV